MRDLETLRKAERNILCGVGFALLLFLIYASTSISVPPPLKGLPSPANTWSDQSSIQNYYTVPYRNEEVWASLDIQLQIQGFKRDPYGYWMYRRGKNEQVYVMVGEWRPGGAPQGRVDGRIPGKITLLHIVRTDSWKLMWNRFALRWKQQRQIKMAMARRSASP